MDVKVLKKAYQIMSTARAMSDLYDAHFDTTKKYVYATSKGHEAVQIALGMQLLKQDWLAPYYRDDAILTAIGLTPYELMLQLMAKKHDPFSGGRTYYCHPSLRKDNLPNIPHQSSATGMQAIPMTGVAMGLQYREQQRLGLSHFKSTKLPAKLPISVCSMGDAAMSEGEVSEALHMASLKQLPILYLIQDNDWSISAHSSEIRSNNAAHFAKGFKNLEVKSINGYDFIKSYTTLNEVISTIRKERRPFLIHAKVPLLGHHTSGIKKEWYRDDLAKQQKYDPFPLLRRQLMSAGCSEAHLNKIEQQSKQLVEKDYKKASTAAEPSVKDLLTHDFAPTSITKEQGTRKPAKIRSRKTKKTLMVNAGVSAIREILAQNPQAILYGQDVGARLGGVFREAAQLAKEFGNKRVFNTPIQEAFIIGSTVGMSAVECHPIVEIQFADYIWPGLNQLFTEVSRSCYLSNGKWPVKALIRIPIGSYGSGGPYHSSSIESILTNIRGIKVVYPSNAADLKGLMKAAYHDPNPVVMLEHKGLYWANLKETRASMTEEPSSDYVIPLGKARQVLAPNKKARSNHKNSLAIITYGMGVYWAMAAAKEYPKQVEIIDLRTLAPLDKKMTTKAVKKHRKCLIVTEESSGMGFAKALAGELSDTCFTHLKAPIKVIGAEDLPAIPLNEKLEKAMMPNAEKVSKAIKQLLDYR